MARQRKRPSNHCQVPSVVVGSAVLLAGLGAALIQAWQGNNSADSSIRILAADRETASVHVIFAYDSAALEAHYLEHLVWLNAVGAERAADRHSNAWTSDTAVGYWLSGAPEDLPDLLETLKGVFDPINLPSEFAGKERDIVLREYEFRMTDNPDAQAGEAMKAFLYDGNVIAVSPIGTPDEIMMLDYDAARAVHAATHVPANARLVVIGDVTERRLRRAMRDAGWPEMEPADVAPPPFELVAPETTTLRYPDPDAAPRMGWRRVVALPEPVQFDLLEAQTALLRDILDTNLPGGLAGPLRFDAAVARSFDVQVWPIDEDNIEISFSAAPDAGVSLTQLKTAFEDTLSEVANGGIPEATYSRVLNRFDGFWPDWDDDDETSRWMADYVLDRVSNLRGALSKRELQRLHRGLSLDTTNELLRQLAGDGRTAIAFIGPEESFE
ncbi:hypothetical protein CCR78_05255 [Rhodovulum imhoffii]|nr:hypothetical protein [Rhodovulum imhoffii]